VHGLTSGILRGITGQRHHAIMRINMNIPARGQFAIVQGYFDFCGNISVLYRGFGALLCIADRAFGGIPSVLH
jgi:hypothetical protein